VTVQASTSGGRSVERNVPSVTDDKSAATQATIEVGTGAADGLAGPTGSLDDGRPRPVQVRATVLANRAAGAYRHLVLMAPGAGEAARPGQFAALAVGAEPGRPTATLLRRAFSLHRSSADGTQGPTVDIVVAAHGPGSEWVTRRRAGDELNVVAPLGRPFPAPPPGAHAVLVGGGYGSAPMGWWARDLTERGHPVSAVLGAGDADRLFGAEDLAEVVTELAVTTDDGSAGRRGLVTDALPPLLIDADGRDVVVYACGPMAMLRAVSALATQAGARIWCTVEESMACGIGVCMTCVLPVRGADGLTRMTRTCVEGPTLDGAAVRWDAVRCGPGSGSDVPADCVGAPRPGGH
jgi:dihydroorotate dehydrogenase electron transfer subunit